MAQELRIIRGDSYDLICSVKDSSGAVVPILANNWKIGIESEHIRKDMDTDPSDFIVETGDYGTGEFVIGLRSDETDIGVCVDHFRIILYKPGNPVIRKTVATGDFYFIREA